MRRELKSSLGARRPNNVSLPVELVAEARNLAINLSCACEQGIVTAIKAERERRWKTENKAAIEDYNRWVDEHGLPLAGYRQF